MTGDETELREPGLWDAIAHIEGLSTKRLVALAEYQRETIMRMTPNWKRVCYDLDATVRSILL